MKYEKSNISGFCADCRRENQILYFAESDINSDSPICENCLRNSGLPWEIIPDGVIIISEE